MHSVIFIFSFLFSIVHADKCNPLATLIETDSFYLTQPYTTNITIDIASYVEAFPKLATLIPKFTKNLEIYSNRTAIELEEPIQLFPFTDDLNAFIIKDPVYGKDAYKKCADNGGTLIKATSSNRLEIVKLLKDHELDKTPIHVLPFYSLLSFSDFEPLDTPDNLDNMVNAWQKSPPWLTSENKILMPTTKITVSEGVTEVSTPLSFKTPVICQKVANPWDLSSDRNAWFKVLPKIRTAIKMLNKLKTSYELASKSLTSVPTITKTVTDVFKLTLPEPFQLVLDFLDKYSKKINWNRMTKFNQIQNFIKTALKLVRQFELNPKSITQLKEDDSKFQPLSINEFNWRESFELDESTYGIVGPATIQPYMAHLPDDGSNKPISYDAIITAKVYNRKTDKITVHSVKANTINGEITTIKSIVETYDLKVALLDEIKPLDCFWHETEHYKICHRMPIQQVVNMPVAQLTKCARALWSEEFSPDFALCPRKSIKTLPNVYRAECGPNNQITAIVNSDSPVTVEFKCDGEKQAAKNFSSFPSFINTPCEVYIVDGSNSHLTLPQWNADFLQAQTVGDERSFTFPFDEISQKTLIILCAIISIMCAFLMIIVACTFYLCCTKCKSKCTRNTRNRRRNEDNEISPYLPAIQLHEFPFTN